jgi:hypothetical protein
MTACRIRCCARGVRVPTCHVRAIERLTVHALLAQHHQGSRANLTGSPWMLTSANGTVVAPAAVPGDAHGALQAAGIIGDVYHRFNDATFAWVAVSDATAREGCSVGCMCA